VHLVGFGIELYMFRTGFLSILMMDRKTCPKHVEFYSKNKYEKSVHLVGFITRRVIYVCNLATPWSKDQS